MTDNYQDFLARKRICDPMTGMADVGDLPPIMKPHQSDIARWALRRGRAAVFAGTGLGKTLIELVWAQKVSAYTAKPVLIFAPLAVAAQHIREANKFGIAAQFVKSQSDVVGSGVYVTNIQKIEHFDMSQFCGVVIDESSCLKSCDSSYRALITERCKDIAFRLAATATPAPNDFMELGNHAEFLGIMSYTDMLSTFFIHDGGDTAKWRLKGHAEDAFWRWMASWSVLLRKPSDLGYDDAGYDLPPLRQHSHRVGVEYAPSMETGLLFPMEAGSLQERIAARRSSVADRVAMAIQLVPNDRPCIVWCNLNSEQDELEKQLAGRCVSVRGSNSDDENEKRILAWLSGEKQIIISKVVMLGFGLNFQNCNDMIFVGLTDSFEQVFQAIRRCWRFGQTKPVDVHFVFSEMEGAVLENLKRKEADAERMADGLVKHMSDLNAQNVRGMVRDTPNYLPAKPFALPSFLGA